MTKKVQPEITSLSKNKKAFHDYEILEKFEAGIVLSGEDVKSIRLGLANLKGSFVDVFGEEAFANELHVSRYKFSSNKKFDPTRRRKLILHKKEIIKIAKFIGEKGVTAVPLELYLKKGLIKMEIGICRGKKLFDKRETLKKKDNEIEIRREMKRFE